MWASLTNPSSWLMKKVVVASLCGFGHLLCRWSLCCWRPPRERRPYVTLHKPCWPPSAFSVETRSPGSSTEGQTQPHLFQLFTSNLNWLFCPWNVLVYGEIKKWLPVNCRIPKQYILGKENSLSNTDLKMKLCNWLNIIEGSILSAHILMKHLALWRAALNLKGWVKN